MIRVSILGATGYSGGELLRLLLKDKGVKIQHLTSESSPGSSVDSVHPALRGMLTHRFESLNVPLIAKDSDLVFSCYPAGAGISPNARFVKAGVKVIDLSADFRLPSAQLYKKWYKLPHTAPALLKKAVYGLPEYFRSQIAEASLIANPGCYATAALLAALPLVNKGVIDPHSLIIDAKSGVSGAGKKLTLPYMFGEVDENFQAYAIASHRHQPEMEQIIRRVAKTSATVTFSPHLVPMNRGILSVLYATLKKPLSLRDIRSLYLRAYEGEPFVRILPEGELPQTKNVAYSNYCDIGITADPRTKRVIVLSAIDNLVKGAAGQAIQNMNICFHRPEREGLV